jgi:hypothetical protein
MSSIAGREIHDRRLTICVNAVFLSGLSAGKITVPALIILKKTAAGEPVSSGETGLSVFDSVDIIRIEY